MFLSLHRCWTFGGKFEQLFFEGSTAPLLIAFLHPAVVHLLWGFTWLQFFTALEPWKGGKPNDAAVGKHWTHRLEKMMVVWSLVSVTVLCDRFFYNSCKQIRSTNRSSPVPSPTSQPQLNTLQVDLELLSRKATCCNVEPLSFVFCLWSTNSK